MAENARAGRNAAQFNAIVQEKIPRCIVALRVFADVHSILVNLGWRMFSHRVQHASQIDEVLSIQM
ncbi:MAG: hypothetical protein HY070_07935 [Chloroflexi bacterium]|nr:hypothetical protein [Chloroflexota bacterium]MBI3740815.1 hypothetical protein [Chloroflexota bacterium]